MTTRKNAATDPRGHAPDGADGEPAALDGIDGPPEPEIVPLGPVAALLRRTILIGVLPVLSGGYLWQASVIALPERALAVSPRSFPIVLGVLMCVTALGLAVVEVRRMLAARGAATRDEEVAPEIDDDQERITSWRDAWVTFAALVVYVATFALLGFVVSTVAFLICLSTYFSPRRLLRNAIVSVVFSAAVYLLFVNVLNVQLPAGLLSGVM